MICPQTLTNIVSTSSSLNTSKPNQVLDLIYILKLLQHLLPYPNLKPQRRLLDPNSKSWIKQSALNQQCHSKINQDISKPNHTPCIPQPPHQHSHKNKNIYYTLHKPHQSHHNTHTHTHTPKSKKQSKIYLTMAQFHKYATP